MKLPLLLLEMKPLVDWTVPIQALSDGPLSALNGKKPHAADAVYEAAQ